MSQHQPDQTKVSSDSDQPHSSDYAPYPRLDPNDVAPSPENWSSVPVGPAPINESAATTMPPESNPYVSPSPVPQSSAKNKMESVKGVLTNWGKKAAEATKKAEDLAGNMWQHLKTAPSFADAAVGRIAQGTKVLAEGGYEKIFRQNFECVPEEQLLKTYACYLSTSAGPVMGVLYLSTAKLAFCSDNPLSYKVGEETQYSYYKELSSALASQVYSINWPRILFGKIKEQKSFQFVLANESTSPFFPLFLAQMLHKKVIWDMFRFAGSFLVIDFVCNFLPMYTQVVIPLPQVRAVNPSTSKVNPAEKYIQVLSIDNHEFWFMGFVHYDSAVKNLQDVLKPRS
ncbi:hypothetical protein JRO89_XS07G0122700 [Xanthoceras sorbifolium]|uniref:GRAM domain-containing protein n=1 Tax=Xanthoceras sorbifolium TaxID=99658 RepID=A0ABQ8HTQ1_9ROSI|nr:hypothetical protein JRO89_XS07G0122700 [Xanthoceras sorbifolium]